MNQSWNPKHLLYLICTFKIQSVFSWKPPSISTLWTSETDKADCISQRDENECFSNDKKGHSMSMSRQSRREYSHLFQSWVQLRCDAACSHSRAGHFQRLHNPGFFVAHSPSQPLPLHLSLSHTLSLSRLSTAKWSRHRWSTHQHLCCTRQGGAGLKGKSDRGYRSQ